MTATPPSTTAWPAPARLAGREVPLRVLAAPGAIDQLPRVLAGLGSLTEPALLHDTTAKSVRGADVLALVRQAFIGAQPRDVLVPGGLHGVVLDESTIQAAVAAVRGCDLAVGVGSGTICDLAKQVGAELAVPVVLVQTAASVNGYADSLSVLVRGGAKRTVSSCWPYALVVDHDVLTEAPLHLTRAGVGDAVALWCAPADWYLACAMGLDPASYDTEAVATVLESGERLAAGDPGSTAGLAALSETLTLGGLSIGVTGTTATLSGVEHLVSHLLDMAAMAEGEPHDLHGAQVGVASVLSAALWECALDEVGLGALDPDAFAVPVDLDDQVRAVWSEVDPSGGVGAQCLLSVRSKAALWQTRLADGTFASAWADWARHDKQLRSLVRAPEHIAGVLGRWGAPTRFAELTPSVSTERVRWVLRALPLMRDRSTLVDVLMFAGRWDEALMGRVLDRTAVACAAAV